MHAGSIDGATSVLIDEPITVRDDNYFPCAQEPAAEPANKGAGDGNNNNSNVNANGDRQASGSSRVNNSTEEVGACCISVFA